MLNRNQAIFKKSILAAAVLSVSACSSLPRVDDYDLSKVGEGILTAGKTTADVSGRVWKKTAYLLGFSDDDGSVVTDDQLLMDEVDLAMLEEDAKLPDQPTVNRVLIPNATPNRTGEDSQQLALVTDSNPLNTINQTGTQTSTPIQLESDIANTQGPVMPALDEEVLLNQAVTAIAEESAEDLVHEVASNETLWDISKKLTGDANNWHLLADVNNLAPNAAVYPGQQLIIPSELLKEEYDDDARNEVAGISLDAPEERKINTQDIVEGTSYERKPLSAESDETAETVLASASSEAVDSSLFEIQSGESLWDFAKRTTGDATNWQAIASHNAFSENQSRVVREGQAILVPNELIRPELSETEESVAEAPALETAPLETAEDDSLLANTSTILDETLIEVEENVIASTTSLDDASLDDTEQAERIIVEATFKKEDSTVTPLIEETETIQPLIAEPSLISEVMISGSYYPKAIYNSADFSSSLLMRVSPGTTLRVSDAVGNWYEVETSKGIGYVHKRDIK